MKEALEYLQADKSGFRYPHHPERLNVNPAKLTQLQSWFASFSELHHAFVPFVESVTKDYHSPETNPSTFDRPLYHDLHAIIEEQLRIESGQAESVPRE
ncbi:MAG: hypothetical protein V4819_05580 [Verrucomicrobiota bacterium]